MQVHCDSQSKSSNNSRIESDEYKSLEKSDFTEAINSAPHEDYPIDNSIGQEQYFQDYDGEPPKHFRPVVPYDRYPENEVPPYMRRPQPEYILPSEPMESLAPKPMATPIMENQIKQQPVYANLYWRKIVYPHPSFSGQNDILMSGRELQTEESNLVNRRYIALNPQHIPQHIPHQNPYRYYRKRRRYPLRKTMNGRPQMSGYYNPIHTQSSRIRPNSVHYYKTPPYTQRRIKVRPIPQNMKNNYFYNN